MNASKVTGNIWKIEREREGKRCREREREAEKSFIGQGVSEYKR